jgi:organic hydroperoxide reductase OsmC/OhrA
MHTYRTALTWSGSTRKYEDYERGHDVKIGPAPLRISADAAFLGDSGLANPEQLLVAAASSCQLLSFLAVAARSGVDVLKYLDDAEGQMPEGGSPMRVTRITLRPHVVVRGGDRERVERLLHKAHQQCYIANSLTSEVALEPTIEVL